MSQFENYYEISRYYDLTRVPVGLDIIISALIRYCTPLENLTLLDAGCGTGAYTAALIRRVHHIEAIDLNPGMLAIAKKRLACPRTLVNFQLGSIDTTPFEDATIGAVMVNQVLHHLGDTAQTGWAGFRHVFRECFRILKSGGILILNSCTHQQLELGFWFYSLISDASNQVKQFLPSDTVLDGLLENSGFEVVSRHVPYNEVLQGERYFEPEGILDPSWRCGDSIWSLVSPSDLDRALIKVTKLLNQNRLVDFMQLADSHRPEIGQTTFTIARRVRAI
jgi:ubiquinone/menaquinone biosynthesis C-methylase UbiE